MTPPASHPTYTARFAGACGGKRRARRIRQSVELMPRMPRQIHWPLVILDNDAAAANAKVCEGCQELRACGCRDGRYACRKIPGELSFHQLVYTIIDGKCPLHLHNKEQSDAAPPG